ncbi:ornithine carbamoyltransferase [Puniceicoccales bacterium CK1056]|uniref:Ornithine carbamoyltransferase n=1 Tax=Oceanipulchritudo coccoides TaxID=2706888 RepID=A0A6B2M3D5_9BACT|nr:ornithine carbamoyltransferase [Oceanipulchritudo coccoides]NDV62597.1 ornithine carbamoyltransferase [Oceanipulchritudo coccoides]
MTQLSSFLKTTDLSQAQLGEVLELAARFKANRGDPSTKPLDGQTWALLFHKSSTRTRISFEVGIHELGGHTMILDQNSMQTGRGETVEDTAKVLSRYIHGIIIRTFEHQFIEDIAHFGSIPVVNALTDALHPCQIVSDLLTLAERWGEPGSLLDSLKGRKLVFFGDCASNMAHSWILGGALAGMEIVLCGPEKFAPKPFVNDLLKEAGLEQTYTFTSDVLAAAKAADAVYTDVWVSMGDEDEREQRLQEMAPYQVNASVMGAAKPDAFFLHCLPAHEGEEVSSEVYKSAQSIVFDEAENRLHAQKAILSFLGAR